MKRLFAIVLTGVFAVLIAHFMLRPAGDSLPPFPHFDKVVHILAFACLVLPVVAARCAPLIWVFVSGLAYGAAIELIQPSFGRTADWLDLAADAVGLLLGIAMGRMAHRLAAS